MSAFPDLSNEEDEEKRIKGTLHDANSPFPSCCLPRFQSESWCTTRVSGNEWCIFMQIKLIIIRMQKFGIVNGVDNVNWPQFKFCSSDSINIFALVSSFNQFFNR